ncbi:hypothetical protein, partial [Clostridium butyricum]|uniref:hypothetical protein n=1 Tax=Clostridium butyricum TaxID=1492 RepID=UPI00374EBB8A
MKNLKNILFALLSFTPIFSITKDSKFVTNTDSIFEDNEMVNGIRFSLFNIHFGKYKIYVLTYIFNDTEEKKFNLIKILNLDNLFFPNGYADKVDEKAVLYENHYKNLTESEKRIELEFIKYKLNEENARIDASKSKIGLYISILLVIIPIIIVLFKPNAGDS